MDKVEAVRRATLEHPEASSVELAQKIEEQYGITMKPPIVTVIRAMFEEKAFLSASRNAALQSTSSPQSL